MTFKVNSQEFRSWCNALDVATPLSKPLIMGVLNVTPNSFFDGGRYRDLNQARSRALTMLEQGADLIDLGGEASNPYGGYESISVDEELSRVIPVLQTIRDISDVCISIDTCKAEVMREAVAAGASLINDIQALEGQDSLRVAQQLNVPVCLMHMNGTPQTMQDAPEYQHDVVDEINQFFSERVEACVNAGIPRELLILDPGIGFGKSMMHNLNILNHLPEFHRHRRPLLLGVSRKRVIGDVLQKPVSERMIGSIAAAVYASLQGVAMIRTHDIDETNQALTMVSAIYRYEN